MTPSSLAWRIVLPAFAAAATIVVLVHVLARDITTEDSTTTPASAEHFEDFPVLWLGESFEGSPLDGEYAPPPDAFSAPFIITYGSCGAAFVSGCEPDFAIKTYPGCLVDPAPNLKIRERPARHARHLEIETGDTVVTIYAADADAERRAADQMVHANPNVARGGAVYEPSQPLSGSLCEVVRINPPPTRTPYPTETPDPDRALTRSDPLPSTVFASFGGFESVESLQTAQEQLGWRVLSTYDPRYTLVNAGAIRTYAGEFGGLEQTGYEALGGSYPLQVHQAPITNRHFDPSAYAVIEDIGRWKGAQVWSYKGGLGIKFQSGESIDGVPILVSVSASQPEYTLDELRQFVATLEFLD